MPRDPTTDATTVQVRLLGVPLRIRARLVRHLEGLQRELALVQIGGERGAGTSLPRRLLELAVELETTYAPYRAQPAQDMADALAAGAEFLDVEYAATARSGAYIRHLGDVLEEADEFCRAEQHLLTLPAGAELVAFRRWIFGEIVRQLAGEEPRPWPGAAPGERPAARPPGHVPAPALPMPVPTPVGPVPVSAAAPGGAAAGRLLAEPLVLESAASAAAAARRYVRRALRELDAADLEEPAELAVSELVTNAVLHAHTAFTVAVRTTPGGRVRVEVSDTSPVPVEVRAFGTSATTGRGLQLVAASSADWGIDPLPGGPHAGKTVWFEPQAAPAVPAAGAQEWAAELEALL
ncbi:hypothetical protein NUM3379_02310 [Kineococcus sp. NUM-3379]